MAATPKSVDSRCMPYRGAQPAHGYVIQGQRRDDLC